MSYLSASRIYDFYGGFYDALEILFRRRIAEALAAVPFHRGDQALDVGVGTGFSLKHYPHYVHVTGIDSSTRMLTAASRKVYDGKVTAATRLLLADALDLPFPNHRFEVVVLSHMLATVSDPLRCLAEAVRVTRNNGILVLINHSRSIHPVLRWLENVMDPVTRRLGWSNKFSLVELLTRAGVRNAIQAQPPQRGSIFQTVYLQKNGESLQVISLRLPRVTPRYRFGLAGLRARLSLGAVNSSYNRPSPGARW